MMEQENKPKWLLELENRKRKPQLAHEAGAGACCLICESACSGLDLHFWRKVCKNCKCRGDDHDINDIEFPQFELLFGPNIKNKKNRSLLLQVNDKKQLQSEISFEWVPNDTTKELAADYMKALPLKKLPIKGSPGAAFRRQQLQKQLPLHDIDYKACDGLNEEERKEFEKYLDKLKNCAGQGKVTKLTTTQPFQRSLMTPANATDVQKFSPQHSQQLLKPIRLLNLRTPSSFIPKVSQTHIKFNLPFVPNDSNVSLVSNVKIVQVQNLQAVNEVQHQLEQYHHTLTNISNNSNLAIPFDLPRAYYLEPHLSHSKNQENRFLQANQTACELKHSKNPSSIVKKEYVQSDKASESFFNDLGVYNQNNSCQSEQNLEFSSDLQSSDLLAEQLLSEALLPPSAVNASNIVGSSLDQKGLMYIQEKLSNKYSNENYYQNMPRELEHISHHSLISNSEEIKQDLDKVKQFENISINLNECNKNQLPYQPLCTASKHFQTKRNISSAVQSNTIHSELLNNAVFPENAVGTSVSLENLENINKLEEEMTGMTMNIYTSYHCHKCDKDIHCSNVVVTAEKIKDAVWHPGCFTCSACNELLVDLIYFTYKGKLYCGRDLAKLLEIPRCFACDELIFVRKYTVAEGHNYHVKHFCCWDCDIPLAGQQYISENDRPLCLPCYQKNYAKTCDTCNNIIAADQQGVAIKNLNFHAIGDCFCCFICKKNLLGGQIAIKENKPLCSKECIAKFLYRRALDK